MRERAVCCAREGRNFLYLREDCARAQKKILRDHSSGFLYDYLYQIALIVFFLQKEIKKHKTKQNISFEVYIVCSVLNSFQSIFL